MLVYKVVTTKRSLRYEFPEVAPHDLPPGPYDHMADQLAEDLEPDEKVQTIWLNVPIPTNLTNQQTQLGD